MTQENALQIFSVSSAASVATLWGRTESGVGVATLGHGDRIAVALADGRIRPYGLAAERRRSRLRQSS